MIDDQIIRRACEEFRTPLYLYDENEIQKNANLLKNTVFENAKIFFSMKANPSKEIMKIILKLGFGVEVASMGEMLYALEVGFELKNLIFTGPGKEYDELECAIEKGIYCINIENISEIEMICEIASRKHQEINIAFRINPYTRTAGKFSMAGVTQFGIGADQIATALKCVEQNEFVHMIGFQVYMGTEILDADIIKENVEEIARLGFELADQYGIELQYLNMGGGFGVPYFPNDASLNMEQLRVELQNVAERFPRLKEIDTLVFESGRFILAEAGVFVIKVLYEKTVNDKKFLICDGGSNFHSSAAFLGRFVRNNFPMHSISVNQKEDRPEEVVTIVGNLCTPTDVVGQNVKIARAEVGDYIVVEKSGAYGLSFSPLKFLKHREPMEVVFANDEFRISGE